MMYRVLLALVLFLLSACSGIQVKETVSYPVYQSRLLLYLHSTAGLFEDLRFNLSNVSLQDEGGDWLNVFEGPVSVSSRGLASKQMLIRELILKPGNYRSIRFVVSEPYVRTGRGDISLAIPEPNGEVVVESPLNLREGDSTVVSLSWKPKNSVSKEGVFTPDIQAEPQTLSTRDLLLFISNSASNYLSIMDRSLERVVGAVTVGIKPAGMAFNSTKDLLYVVNSGSNNISVVDTTQLRVDDTIPLTAGIDPKEIVFVPEYANSIDGTLYITNKRSNDITVLSTLTRRVLKTIYVDNRPSAIAADYNAREVYVTNEMSDSLSIINTADNTLVSSVTVGRRPTGIVIGTENIYIMNEGSSSISVVSKATRKVVTTIPLIASPSRGIFALGDKVFITSVLSDNLTALKTPQNVPTWSLPVGPGPLGMAWDEKRNRLYVANSKGSTVTIIDPLAERLLKEQEVGSSPYGVLLLER